MSANVSSIWANQEIYSNIAAVDGRHSDHGLFAKQREPLLVAVSQKHLASGSDPLVVYRYPGTSFEKEVVDSRLLSRGWVYQEIHLAAANLYCTDAQMRWSCAHTSVSEAFPIHDDREKVTDRIQESKNAMMGHKETSRPIESWMSVLHRYASTTTTYDGDRLIALKGLSDLFRSLYPEKLGNAEYHSGLWSTDMIKQLWWSWYRSDEEGDPPGWQPNVTTYRIPSWSPLKDVGRRSTGLSLYSDWGLPDPLMLPNRFVSMNTSHLDEFGRATSWEACEIHLQGVLVDMTPPTTPYDFEGLRSMAHPAGHPNARVVIGLDNSEEQDLFHSAPGYQLRALTIGVLRASLDTPFLLFGILLRLFDAQPHSKSPRPTGRWVRCGHFKAEIFHVFGGCSASQAREEVVAYENAFQLTRKYGVKWELESPEEDDSDTWSWRQKHLHDPELEDIYIV